MLLFLNVKTPRENVIIWFKRVVLTIVYFCNVIKLFLKLHFGFKKPDYFVESSCFSLSSLYYSLCSLSICVSVCLSVCLSVSLSLSIYLYLPPPPCLSFFLSISFSLFNSLSLYLSLSLFYLFLTLSTILFFLYISIPLN